MYVGRIERLLAYYSPLPMCIVNAQGKVTRASKKIAEGDHYAVSIDVYRVSAKDSLALFEEVEETIEVKKDENSWTEVALDNIFWKTSFKPYIINYREGRWFEIDNHDDLHKAEEIFKGDKLCKI